MTWICARLATFAVCGWGWAQLAILPRSVEADVGPESGMTVHRLALESSQVAGEVLLESFGPAAGAQALFRAFLAEQDRDRLATWFWIEAYWRIMEIDTDSQLS
ncbi:MAG TPA: hypothetical protein VGP28_08950 [Methylocella sp.]|jgi:hypothetical protein|nr:hypothetical protein [Methylocella sp.]